MSGPLAIQLTAKLFHSPGLTLTSARTHTVHYGRICAPNGEWIDDVLVTLFRTPNSYTGEDTTEVACHGGAVTLRLVLQLILSAGARPAEPGEYTARAYMNGRMDLAQAEAVLYQIQAGTNSAHRLALQQRDGLLSTETKSIRSEITGCLAAVEVTIDFSDEVGELNYSAISDRIKAVTERVERLLKTARTGRVFHEGARVAIIGRPNAGKSSLLNLLCGQERAIVTETPGTTRDRLEAPLQIGGVPIVAVDTAGIRATSDPVESIGVARALETAATADILLCMVAADDAVDAEVELERWLAMATGAALLVLNKCDLIPDAPARRNHLAARFTTCPVVCISAKTQNGITELLAALAGVLAGPAAAPGLPIVQSARHEEALRRSLESLIEAQVSVDRLLPADFISIDLRGAADSLGEITGETASDEVIHRIFHDFCVGK